MAINHPYGGKQFESTPPDEYLAIMKKLHESKPNINSIMKTQTMNKNNDGSKFKDDYVPNNGESIKIMSKPDIWLTHYMQSENNTMRTSNLDMPHIKSTNYSIILSYKKHWFVAINYYHLACECHTNHLLQGSLHYHHHWYLRHEYHLLMK